MSAAAASSVRQKPRVVVVGASSGLGRCIALGLADRGMTVAFLARRQDRIVAAAREAGNGAVAVVCDVTDEQSCRRAMLEAADALGGIDGVVYATGVFDITPLADVDGATWGRLFATNVTGAALVTSAALPFLSESRGCAIYLSSVSASLTPPWPNIGAYVTSKAALDKLVEAFRWEYPSVGFTRLSVGDCMGGDGDSRTEFVDAVEQEVFTSSVEDWMRRGYMTGNLIGVDELVHTVEAVLRLGADSTIPSVSLTPRVPRPSPAVTAL